MTPITYTLTEADMVSAVQLGFLRSLRRGVVRLLVTMVVIAALIAFGLGLIIDGGLSHAGQAFMLLTAVYAAAAVVMLPILYFIFVPIRTRKMMRQMPVLAREQILSWDSAHIETSSSNGTMRMPFAELHQWAASDTQVIIYIAEHLLYPFPRWIFADGQQFQGLQDRLRSAGVQRI
jgi:hypothetical protein